MFEKIITSFRKFPNRPSFVIRNTTYTYADFEKRVTCIKHEIENATQNNQNQVIAVNAIDHIDTYASLIAILFSGNTYLPINPEHPIDRNIEILELAGSNIILSPIKNVFIEELCKKTACSSIISSNCYYFENCKGLSAPSLKERNAYLLFTSGSTGKPKGVPISVSNLNSFVDAFFQLGYKINEQDRFLQMFELTFDLSVMSYLIPLCIGACVCTTPTDEIKYMAVYKTLENHEITFALMVPSILSFLKPYFEDILLEKMKYSLFCGEALHTDILLGWQHCIPNSEIHNVYGPTEATIFCTAYQWKNEDGYNEENNGIVSIGKPMLNNFTIIVDDSNEIITKPNIKGELCLAGGQLTEGYWNNVEKNKEAFINVDFNASPERFYRTGDICFFNENGNLMYCGRLDHQVKIQGYRVELSEIEHRARIISGLSNIAAVSKNNKSGNAEIILFVENLNTEIIYLQNKLKEILPPYMMPSDIINIVNMPLNVNGKIDRKALKNLIP